MNDISKGFARFVLRVLFIWEKVIAMGKYIRQLLFVLAAAALSFSAGAEDKSLLTTDSEAVF